MKDLVSFTKDVQEVYVESSTAAQSSQEREGERDDEGHLQWGKRKRTDSYGGAEF